MHITFFSDSNESIEIDKKKKDKNKNLEDKERDKLKDFLKDRKPLSGEIFLKPWKGLFSFFSSEKHKL